MCVGGGGGCVLFWFCYVFPNVLSSFAVVSPGKSELVGLLWLYICILSGVWDLIMSGFCVSSSRCRGVVCDCGIFMFTFLVFIFVFYKEFRISVLLGCKHQRQAFSRCHTLI